MKIFPYDNASEARDRYTIPNTLFKLYFNYNYKSFFYLCQPQAGNKGKAAQDKLFAVSSTEFPKILKKFFKICNLFGF